MLQTLRLNHAAADGLLYSMPTGGFARLSVDGLGGDALAAHLFKQFAAQESVCAVVEPTHDERGFTVLSLRLRGICPAAITLPVEWREFLDVQFRKAMLVGLGTVVPARVERNSSRGAVVSLPNGIRGVVVMGSEAVVPEEGETLLVSVLDFDVAAGFAVVRAAKAQTLAPPALASRFAAGETVNCTVSHVPPGKNFLVVEASSIDGESSVGYILPSKQTFQHGVSVGAQVEAHVRFVPDATLEQFMPFVFLTTIVDDESLVIPEVRTATMIPSLAQRFSWRIATADERNAAELDNDNAPRMRKRKLEEAIDAFERDKNRLPSSPEEYQKLLLANPNSSFLWTQYMAHHVALHQVDLARTVGEKALKTIGVREGKELLNVWVALMNLENLHGTAESLTAVFRRALQHADDELVVYEKLANIFEESRKWQQLMQICHVMTSKFGMNPRTWEKMGFVLVDGNKADQLKSMFKGMSRVLKKNDQLLVVEHIGVHQYKRGAIENARSLFEGLIVKCPTRSDIWSVYIDQEVALLARRDPHASVATTRSIFQRVATLKIPPKTMQQFLMRFLKFEEAFGTEGGAEEVRQIARRYVDERLAKTSAGAAVVGSAPLSLRPVDSSTTKNVEP